MNFLQLIQRAAVYIFSRVVPNTRKVNNKPLSADVELDKSDVGLGNVDNTADLDKPISTMTQTALDGKVDKVSSGVGSATKGAYLDSDGKLAPMTYSLEADVPPDAFDAATAAKKGLVKIGDNVSVTADGAISVPDGSTSTKGAVQLSNATDSDAENLAATPKSVKAAYDLANSKVDAAEQEAVDAKQDERIGLTEKLLEGIESAFYRSAGPAASVSFSDGYPANVKALSVDIAPVQDLNGYDHPWPEGGGENLYKRSTAATVQGLTFNALGDGTVIITGTKTTTGNTLFQYDIANLTSGVTYLCEIENGVTSSAELGYTLYIYMRTNEDNYTAIKGSGQSFQYTPQANCTMRIYLCVKASNTDIPVDRTVKIKVSILSNICPISGWNSVSITVNSRNLVRLNDAKENLIVSNTNWADGTWRSFGSGTGTRNVIDIDAPPAPGIQYGFEFHKTAGNSRLGYAQQHVPIQPNGVYTISCYAKGSGGFQLLLSDGTKSFTIPSENAEQWGRFSATITVGNASEAYFIASATSIPSDIMICGCMAEKGETLGAWEKGEGAKITCSFVDSNGDPLTVYGGRLDVANGVLTVTHGHITSFDPATDADKLSGAWMSDRDVYAQETLPTTGAQVVYELSTPITYQLTAQQLTTLAGYNTISADTGDVSVTYRADPALAYSELESNLTNAILSLGMGI